MKLQEIWQPVIALGVVVGLILGAISYFATAEDLRLTQMRLEQKIVNDRVLDLQRMIWQLEDRYKGRPCETWPEKDRNVYRELKLELEMTKKKSEGLK